MTDRVDDCIAALTLVLDETREARELVLICHAGLTRRPRPWWRRVDSLIGTQDAFLANLAGQYLGENLFRAREHWRAAAAQLGELFAGDDLPGSVVALQPSLVAAGADRIAHDLDDDIVPRQRKDAAAHLSAVIGHMSDCDRLIGEARSRLLLERMRERPGG